MSPEASAKGDRCRRSTFYLLRSEAFPNERYTGFTTDLESRITSHNAGASKHTAKYRPWRLVAYFAFADERRAKEFEFYLKSGSGMDLGRTAFACSLRP
ncbi:MAG: GIY-YIG nuclease family protein [Caulobacteraceae bacterium]